MKNKLVAVFVCFILVTCISYAVVYERTSKNSVEATALHRISGNEAYVADLQVVSPYIYNAPFTQTSLVITSKEAGLVNQSVDSMKNIDGKDITDKELYRHILFGPSYEDDKVKAVIGIHDGHQNRTFNVGVREKDNDALTRFTIEIPGDNGKDGLSVMQMYVRGEKMYVMLTPPSVKDDNVIMVAIIDWKAQKVVKVVPYVGKGKKEIEGSGSGFMKMQMPLQQGKSYTKLAVVMGEGNEQPTLVTYDMEKDVFEEASFLQQSVDINNVGKFNHMSDRHYVGYDGKIISFVDNMDTYIQYDMESKTFAAPVKIAIPEKTLQSNYDKQFESKYSTLWRVEKKGDLVYMLFTPVNSNLNGSQSTSNYYVCVASTKTGELVYEGVFDMINKNTGMAYSVELEFTK